MPHTRAWDETKPAGSDFASTLDDQARELKVDLRERLSVCFVWATSQADDGKVLTLPFKAADNTSLVSVSAANSLTGSDEHSMIDLAQTWNTSGNPTAVKVNITNTASGAASKLLDLQVGGVSKF